MFTKLMDWLARRKCSDEMEAMLVDPIIPPCPQVPPPYLRIVEPWEPDPQEERMVKAMEGDDG